MTNKLGGYLWGLHGDGSTAQASQQQQDAPCGDLLYTKPLGTEKQVASCALLLHPKNSQLCELNSLNLLTPLHISSSKIWIHRGNIQTPEYPTASDEFMADLEAPGHPKCLQVGKQWARRKRRYQALQPEIVLGQYIDELFI